MATLSRPLSNPAGRPSIVSHHRRSVFKHQTRPARAGSGGARPALIRAAAAQLMEPQPEVRGLSQRDHLSRPCLVWLVHAHTCMAPCENCDVSPSFMV